MHKHPILPKRIIVLVAAIATFAPTFTAGAPMVLHDDDVRPVQQQFTLTAYYSPLPDQCCYVKGSFEADVILNGKGTNGADGTEVYPGMIAAPKSYPFGTRIVLPGIGTLTVHDRGGAINVLDTGVHRLDVWMGHGEEGLARALAFGVRHVKGTVYAPGSSQPNESFALADFAAPLERLKPYAVSEPTVLSARAKLNTKAIAVELLQKSLRDIGYFSAQATGFFGPQTQKSLETFLRDVGLDEPSTELTERAAAFLAAALERKDARLPIDSGITAQSDKRTIARAQRTLRFLGYYRGRTNGVYDERLGGAIIAFQKDEGLVTTATEPWAGTVGPKTQARIAFFWKRKLLAIRAQHILDRRRVADMIREKGFAVSRFLEPGDQNADVRSLQRFLISRGFLPAERVTGLFGDETRAALIAYQISADIIKDASDQGAGRVGPATLAKLRTDQEETLYRLVRAGGWEVL